MSEIVSVRRGLLALSPVVLFIVLYVVLCVCSGDFYAMPITVAFMIASVYAVCVLHGKGIDERVTIFSRGAAHTDMLLMLWIFILAGAFASSTQSMGGVQAVVDLCLVVFPSWVLLASLFLASCFISLSLGTSVGTVVALVPITTGLATATGGSLPLVVAAVVGGAFFGDNLSFISDTTIVATRTQGCRMADKFRANILIALPAAVIALAIYVFLGLNMHSSTAPTEIQWLLVVPYVVVLVTALCGMNVMTVLVLGIVLSGIVGILTGSITFTGWFKAMGDGILGMGELIIVTLLAAGLMGVVRWMGGVDFLLQRLTKSISSRRGAEFTIAAIVMFTDICTATNTIAILTVGPLVRDIAASYDISARRAASLLDTFSCVAQGLLPYGAQLLIASGIAGINPIDIIPYLFYPFLLFVCAVAFIIYRPRHRVTT